MKVISVKALPLSKLPVAYVQCGAPAVFMVDGVPDELVIITNDNIHVVLKVGEVKPPEVFMRIQEVIKAAGNRLRRINQDMAKQDKMWIGRKYTFKT